MSATRELRSNGLPAVNRVITTHNDAGLAIYSSTLPDALPWQDVAGIADFSLAYATDTTPVPLNSSADLKTYTNFLDNKPGIIVPGGTVLRYVDMLPGALSPMHRTTSLDYGVVLEGEVVLVLDSGEEKLLRRGDIAVQRGTNHAWRNNSATEWARMLYVLQEAEPVIAGGKELGEDYGSGMGDVKASRA